MERLTVLVFAAVVAMLALSWPALKDKLYMREDWRHPLKLVLDVLADDCGMAYLGKTTMGQGTAIPPSRTTSW